MLHTTNEDRATRIGKRPQRHAEDHASTRSVLAAGVRTKTRTAAAFLIRADARALPLKDRSVQCVVTSPPYFGLRDYGRRKQIGLEASPDAYVAALVAVFAEVRRVLKDNGTVWLNLGDSYSGSGMTGGTSSKEGGAKREARMFHGHRREGIGWGKQKDLLGMPWRVAFALQADGWYLRSGIVWSKPNPMPESIRDRPTTSHEFLFLLAKSPRYYYDSDAIREATSGRNDLGNMNRKGRLNSGGEWTRGYASGNKARKFGDHRGRPGNHLGASIPWAGTTRNKRTVWTIPPQCYKGAHFATMPEKLVEPCILAGSTRGDVCLDPFVGSGTVAAVAQRLGRRGVGIDLRYQHLARERTKGAA